MTLGIVDDRLDGHKRAGVYKTQVAPGTSTYTAGPGEYVAGPARPKAGETDPLWRALDQASNHLAAVVSIERFFSWNGLRAGELAHHLVGRIKGAEQTTKHLADLINYGRFYLHILEIGEAEEKGQE